MYIIDLDGVEYQKAYFYLLKLGIKYRERQ